MAGNKRRNNSNGIIIGMELIERKSQLYLDLIICSGWFPNED